MAESIQNINMMYIQLATIERLDRQRSRLVYVPNLPKLPFSGRLGWFPRPLRNLHAMAEASFAQALPPRDHRIVVRPSTFVGSPSAWIAFQSTSKSLFIYTKTDNDKLSDYFDILMRPFEAYSSWFFQVDLLNLLV